MPYRPPHHRTAEMPVLPPNFSPEWKQKDDTVRIVAQYTAGYWIIGLPDYWIVGLLGASSAHRRTLMNL
jgi:hypothetical protein